ncbi:CYIR protein [Plasmodium cynomolgi strain B]|uniref:CYIR protein n=1 Tax=Plasmodium cynomolgi (strain B) TaxID=1120755 RepID=K6UFC3_PLACD|nr:CYIR protein [Plasmodium cynomolgi strain B]GAB69851.1 CYIR protein [Plasmodium cynomolgi strain B]
MSDERHNIFKETYSTALSFSGELNSQRFYNKLDGLITFSEYAEKCKPTNVSNWRNGVKDTCAKLLYYLKTNEILYIPDAEYDMCPLLNYWVYSQLNKIYSDDSKYIILTYSDIVLIWNSFIQDDLKHLENKICKPISNIGIYDWEKRKELYEYYVDYYPIEQSLERHPQRHNEFCQYVESKKVLYEHFKQPCASKNESRCPQFYAECKKYDPDEVLPTLKCKQYKINEGDVAAPTVPQRENTLPNGETESREMSAGIGLAGIPNLSGKSHTITKVGDILLGVVATSMASGVLYKVNINSVIQINYIILLISFITSP